MRTVFRAIALLAVVVLIFGCKKATTDTASKSPVTQTGANTQASTDASSQTDQNDPRDSDSDRSTEDAASKARRDQARNSLGL